MKVYAVEVNVSNYEHYEDYRHWSFIHKVFLSKDKAIEYLHSDSNLKNIALVDSAHYLCPDEKQPLQIYMLKNEDDRKDFDVWCYSEIYSDDGNEIIGYEPCDNPSDWEKLNYCVSIKEWEVEE